MIVILAVLLALLIATFYCFVLARPVYEATSQIYMVNSQDSIINLSDLQIGSYLTSDYQWIFQTWEIHQMVIDKLSLPYSIDQLRSCLTVTNPNNTRILVITVASHDPQEAAEIANAYATVASQYIADTMLTSKPSLISSAQIPASPARPHKAMILGISAALAAFITSWCLFVAYVINDKIKTEDDLYNCLDAIPLTVIPFSDKISKARSKI